MSDFTLVIGVIAVALRVTGLTSGLVERSPLSFPMMLMGLSFWFGRGGLGAKDIGSHSPLLEVVATLTLALVLFLDAVKLQIGELGKGWLIPGTGIIIGLGAVALALLLGVPWRMPFISGAVIPPTDPVVLREIVLTGGCLAPCGRS